MMKTTRRGTYRPDLTAPFSLNDLLRPREPEKKGFAFGGLVGVEWKLVAESRPIEDFYKFIDKIFDWEESQQNYYRQILLWQHRVGHFYTDREGQILIGGFGHGKSAFSSAFLLSRERIKMQMIGLNLLKLKQRTEKRAIKKLQAKQMKPQRQQWRKQERLRNKRLPGR